MSRRAETELRAAVSAGRRVMLRLDGIDTAPMLRLTLKPGAEAGTWKGTLKLDELKEGVAIERALLTPTASRDQRYQDIVDGLEEMVCRLDAEGRIEFVNAACARLSTRSMEQLIGTSWYELIEPAFRGPMQTQLRLLERAHPTLERDVRLAAPTGRWYRWTLRAQFDQQGLVLGFLGVGRDVHALKALESEIGDISHREQKRLGHDLHDGLGQELTGVSLLMKALQDESRALPEPLLEKIRSIRDLVDQCIGTTRALAQVLSPLNIEREGLKGSISQLVDNMQSVYGLPIYFHCAGNLRRFDEEVATNLYRIVQEALSNAVKHAGARRVDVRLEIRGGVLLLDVEDDGTGLPDQRREHPGMGLKIMRYRANILGASLDLIDRERGGTIVRCAMQTDTAEPRIQI